MTEHNLPDKDDAPWLDCMDGFKTEDRVTRTAQESCIKSSTTLNQSLMTDPSPITPPPELVRHWSRFQGDTHPEALWFRIANEAAQWSADQELEAIIAWMIKMGYWGEDGQAIPLLRAARRPKPLSLKEQALMALEDGDTGPGASLTPTEVSIIRCALEALPDD